MLYEKRELFKRIEEKMGDIISPFPITPNQWTLLSVLFGLSSMFLIIVANFNWAVLLFLISALCDWLNGIIARKRNIYTKPFRYLDTMADRYVDGMVLFGMLFIPFPTIIFPGYVWVFIALFGSLVTAFAKAAAKEKELIEFEMRRGLVTRPERIILLSVGLLFAQKDTAITLYVLIFLAVMSNFTALQRIWSAIKINKNN
ncbi:MAG: CDP-alcohol phosphatidyltransferase family protein [Candidatus Paceibacterota bacterium]